MKIALIGPVHPYRGGISYSTTMLARALSKDHQTTVLSFIAQYPQWLYPGKNDRDPSHLYPSISAEYTLHPLYVWSWWQTAQRIREIGPDLVILPWWTTFWAPAFSYLAYFMRRNKFKFIFLVHNVMPHESSPLDRLLTRAVLRPQDRFICLSAGELRRLQAFYPGARASFSPLPVFDLFLAGRTSKSTARARLKLPTDRPVALFFGIIRPYKGVHDLLEALAILRRQDIPIFLVLAGEIWGDENQYTDQVAGLGITDDVRFDNRYIPNEEVADYFSAADFFVAPYVSGTQSGALKIALAFDLPAVITEPIASSELSQHQLNDLVAIVPAAQPDALAQAIKNSLQLNTSPKMPLSLPSWDELASAILAQGGQVSE